MLKRGKVRARRGADDGMALPLVIVFIVVIGALVAALVVQAQTNFKTTTVTRNHQEKIYAANSALDFATQMIRRDPTLCSNSAGADASETLSGIPQFGGRDVHVTCEGTSGSSAGSGGWAVFVTGAGGGGVNASCQAFWFFSCSAAPKRIVGPVYNGGGWNLNDFLTVQDGFVVQGTTGSCPAQPPLLRVNPTGLNQFRCAAPLPTPPAPWSLTELAGSLPAAAPAPTNPSSSCRVFSPGRHTSMSLLTNGQNYLRSGVYLLDNVNLTVGSGTTLVAGRANGADNTNVALGGSCASAQATDTANGVEDK